MCENVETEIVGETRDQESDGATDKDGDSKMCENESSGDETHKDANKTKVGENGNNEEIGPGNKIIISLGWSVDRSAV